MSVVTAVTGCAGIEREYACGGLPVAARGLKSYVEDRATYNLWANKELVNWLSTVASRFPAVERTVFPMLYGEDFWLERMQGRDGGHTHDPAFTGTVEELLQQLLAQSGKLAAHARALPEAALLEKRALDTAGADTCTLSRAEMFVQCFNDSAYHRGQIIRLARELHFEEPPLADDLRYPAHRAC